MQVLVLAVMVDREILLSGLFLALEGVDVFGLIENLSDVEEGGMFPLLKLYITEENYMEIFIHILLCFNSLKNHKNLKCTIYLHMQEYLKI